MKPGTRRLFANVAGLVIGATVFAFSVLPLSSALGLVTYVGLPTDVPPDPGHMDTDGDGCSDAEELGDNPALGGDRDPNNGWDFFDTPVLDKKVTAGDIFQVVAHFGATDGGASGGYDTAYDRTTVGPNRWNLGPPDGKITAQDIFLVTAQFGHTCQGP